MTPNEQTAVEAIRDFCREWIDVSCQADVVDRCQCPLCKRKRGLEAIALLEASPTVPVSRWIPVTDILPDDNARVFVYTRSGTRTIASFYNGHWFDEQSLERDVTHWKPLDEAPK